MISRNRSVFHGSADPPPRRVTLGTGQPKFRSTWSAMSSSTTMRAACSTMAGFTPYSCSDRMRSLGANRHRRSAFGLRATNARAVIISATYRPSGPYSSHSTRNGQFVTPAIGESTTGVGTWIGPRSTGVIVTGSFPAGASVRGSSTSVSCASTAMVCSTVSVTALPHESARLMPYMS